MLFNIAKTTVTWAAFGSNEPELIRTEMLIVVSSFLTTRN